RSDAEFHVPIVSCGGDIRPLRQAERCSPQRVGRQTTPELPDGLLIPEVGALGSRRCRWVVSRSTWPGWTSRLPMRDQVGEQVGSGAVCIGSIARSLEQSVALFACRPVLLPTQASVDLDHGSWGGRGRSRKLGDGETNPRFSRRFPIGVLWTTPPSVQSVTQSLPRGHGLSTPRTREPPGHSGSSRHQARTASLHKFRTTWPISPGTPRLFPSRSTGNAQHLHPVEHGGKRAWDVAEAWRP